MRQLLLGILFIAFNITAFAQSPESISYQAVVRDNNNEVVQNQPIGTRISILQGSAQGNAVYTETHVVNSNSNGIISVAIGTGNVETGSFGSIDWADGPYYIRTATDITGGTNYSITGTSQLMSVPYALHARTVENDKVADEDADSTNEYQELAISGTQLSISEGNTVTLPTGSGGGDDWGSQTVETTGSLTGEGTTNSPLGLIQSGNAGDILKWDGSNWALTQESSSPWYSGSGTIYTDTMNVGIGTSLTRGRLSINSGDETAISIESEAQNFEAAFSLENQTGNGMFIGAGTSISGAPNTPTGIVLDAGDGFQGIFVTASDERAIFSQIQGSGTAVYGNVFSGSGYSAYFKGGSGALIEDGLMINRNPFTEEAQIQFADDENTEYYVGYNGGDNFNISTEFNNLSGMEVQPDGDVKVSSEVQTTRTGDANMVPIAYGTVSNDQLEANSGNVSITKVGTGDYRIDIDNESYLFRDYTTSLTISDSNPGFIRASSVSGQLIVETFDTNGANADRGFTFVVYKP